MLRRSRDFRPPSGACEFHGEEQSLSQNRGCRASGSSNKVRAIALQSARPREFFRSISLNCRLRRPHAARLGNLPSEGSPVAYLPFGRSPSTAVAKTESPPTRGPEGGLFSRRQNLACSDCRSSVTALSWQMVWPESLPAQSTRSGRASPPRFAEQLAWSSRRRPRPRIVRICPIAPWAIRGSGRRAPFPPGPFHKIGWVFCIGRVTAR